MCGRFTQTLGGDALMEAFPWLDEKPDVTPRYNVAPTQPVAVISNAHRHRVENFVWGLIPSWAADPKIGHRLINARADALDEKPAFRAALRRRRCLIIANGFYEWLKSADGKSRRPHLFRLKEGRPFAFAGLWEVWRPAGGDKVKSCTIITTAANRIVSPVHDRMPLILDPQSYDAWLDERDVDAAQLMPLLRPVPPDEWECYKVSPAVNSPHHDEPDCIVPIGPCAATDEPSDAAPAPAEEKSAARPRPPKRRSSKDAAGQGLLF